MTAAGVTHVLLDFFGTLVGYSPSRTDQGYPRTHELARSLGVAATYQQLLLAWTRASSELDRRSAADGREYSMDDAASGCLRVLTGRAPAPADANALARSYLAEWNKGVIYPPDVPDLVAALASRYRLAVVSNTHDAALVPAHLTAMGIAGHFEVVVTSIEVGWRKPHPAIYTAAMEKLGIGPAAAVFAGDTYDADFAGPARAGLTAYLIDPGCQHDVPAGLRLNTLADLPGRLGIR
jgi:putative hydrolase of the HAD superfamily